jgi:hypothetical protein
MRVGQVDDAGCRARAETLAIRRLERNQTHNAGIPPAIIYTAKTG